MAEIETYARPIWLYRYRSLGLGRSDVSNDKLRQEIKALLDGSIYCSTYNKMNDPMEGLYRSSQKASGHPKYEAFTNQIQSEKLGIGIASFSETWDNELMWAHYADKFQGICVCYSMSKLLATIAPGHTFSRVAYGNRPYLLNLPALLSEGDRARAVLSTKHLSWAYEREWRLFAQAPGLVQHGPCAIRSIYLGARISKVAQRKIRDMLGPLDVPVHTTKIDGYGVVKGGRRSSEDL